MKQVNSAPQLQKEGLEEFSNKCMHYQCAVSQSNVLVNVFQKHINSPNMNVDIIILLHPLKAR